ncbi:MAG: 30S ribosome-binding factor RbfA [Patescibacteria group bacterium]
MPRRIEQVNEVLRKEIALIIERELELPGVMVTVSKVDCARELDSARVWVSVLPDNKAGSALQQLRRQQGFIRHLLAKNILFRRVPQLIFAFDDTAKKAAAVENIFHDLNANK